MTDTALETRWYIGVTPLGRMTVKCGPDKPEKFAKLAPTEPMPLPNGVLLYPVSAEVAAEWDTDDDEPDLLAELDDDEDGDEW